MNLPLVSIIIPVYNRGVIIKDTLESICNQTYKNWECIIVDDFSTDNTIDIIEDYIKDDSRFSLIKKELNQKKGASSSRNIGLLKSNGDYIQFLDSDDILALNKIESQIKLLSNNFDLIKNISVCRTIHFKNIKELNQKSLLPDNRSDYRNFENPLDYFKVIGEIGGYYTCHSFLVHKELINFSGYWNESLTLNDDGEFFFRIISNCHKILFTPNTYVGYRYNIGDNLSILNSEQKAISFLNSFKIIESIYISKFSNENYDYLDWKKWAVYNTLKSKNKVIILKNKCFFKKELKKDNFIYRTKKILKKINRKIKTVIK